ncbi:MAG: cytochrome ubiquinol oxidase subunit I [Gemmatimonadetes bacterium]|nr:cytochrome ubiquinol oxidase subunit I [Gemmatimonadota bacterium]
MSDLFAARAQMATSLAFHILFACIGIAMPVLMVIAEWRWLRTGDGVQLALAKRWSKGTAILFAVGAVSGTVLSFELGLLWPGFMEFAGAIIGMPFSLEGFAFFTEAIFLGIYLYGWNRISARAHLVAGVLVAVSGIASGIFVVIANAWMNAPVGFELVAGRAVNIDPIAAMMTPAALPEALHMTIAAFVATGFAVAGIHAWFLLKDRDNPFHRRALPVALWIAIPAGLLQPFSGHLSAAFVAKNQPAKLAAMEALFETTKGAPLRVGGWPDASTRTVPFSVEIPRGLSFLAFEDVDAEVKGLDAVPRADWPEVRVVHTAFDIMVGLGSYLALVAAWALVLRMRRRNVADHPWLLRALVVGSPMGFVAVEAGWTVTEVGRQPWVITGVVRTAQAVTPMPGLAIPFAAFTLLYAFLGVVVAVLLWRQIARTTPMGEFVATTEFSTVPGAMRPSGSMPPIRPSGSNAPVRPSRRSRPFEGLGE